MKKYAQLGPVHRCEPCEEYPGKWCGGNTEHDNYADACASAFAAWEADTSDDVMKEHGVYWQASDNDHRVGQVWFTGF